MKPELLAPAGSYEALQMALRAGADAVYLGGNRFGARAYANNLDETTLCRAIDEVHLAEKKIYLTVNTLLKQQELEQELYAYLKPYYEQGLDAVIVQDYGVFRAIRRWFPDLHVHCSTQMTITGPEGVKLLEDEGATRIVTARELSLQEISKIHQASNLEIESFVHGALCYCYSGQCLFSSMIGGRSGNRGRCAQPCRLPYQVHDKNGVINSKKHAYALSPKDMCTIEILPQILEAGVTSLKIEGRMKKPEYTAGVVGIYRKCLDRYLENPKSYHVEEADLQALAAIYNRDGFNKSYYQVRNGKQMMAFRNLKSEDQKQSTRESRLREGIYEKIRRQYEDTKDKVEITGTFTIYADAPAVLVLYAGDTVVTVEKEGVQIAKNQPLSVERIEKQLRKTGDSTFEFDDLTVYAGDDVFVPMQFLNEIRRDALKELETQMLSQYRRKAPVNSNHFFASQEDGFTEKCQDLSQETEEHLSTFENCSKNNQDADRGMLSASVETKEQLQAVLPIQEIGSIYLGYDIVNVKDYENHILSLIQQVRDAGKNAYLALPHIYRDGELSHIETSFTKLIEHGLSGYLVRNLETYALLKKQGLQDYVILDHHMYTMNREAQEFWKTHGILGDTAPLELNERELRSRDNHNSEMVIFGHTPMMISAQCVKKNFDSCTKAHERVKLSDRYHTEFTVQCCCNSCYNVIYNSVPTDLSKEVAGVKSLCMKSLRMAFTIEDGKQTGDIARRIVDAYVYGKPVEIAESYTKGHYKRGVE